MCLDIPTGLETCHGFGQLLDKTVPAMKRLLLQFLGRECAHSHMLVVRSAGVTRSVCESCGHMSFTIQTSVARHFGVDEVAEEHLPQAAGL